jgi:hypothetical protein
MPLSIRSTAGVDQLYTRHQTAPTDIAQLREVALQATQMLYQSRPHGGHVFADVVVLEVADDCRTGGHCHLMTLRGPIYRRKGSDPRQTGCAATAKGPEKGKQRIDPLIEKTQTTKNPH